jgi:cell division protein FtsI/penicillin-binding protein 2
LTVVEAIAQSCNVHFYTLATELGSRQVLAGLHRFGIGLDLHSGMAALLATGQDPRLTVDPWQLLHLISSIALRGKGILTQTIAPIDLPSHTWDLLWVGMSKAVTEGTCRSLAPAGISVAAKTGTVLNSQLLSHPLGAAAPIQAEDFQAWLGAFWPLDDPDWAMVMYVHQGKAYEAAIPIARKLIAWVSATAQS